MKREKRHHIYNPSIAQYGKQLYEVRETLETVKTNQRLVKGETVTETLEKRVKKIKDKTVYIKLTELGMETLPCLGKHGIIVLCYIMQYVIEASKDKFIFSNKDCHIKTRLDQSSISKGILDLINNDFIFDAEKPFEFWINIAMYHKGFTSEEFIRRWKEFHYTIQAI